MQPPLQSQGGQAQQGSQAQPTQDQQGSQISSQQGGRTQPMQGQQGGQPQQMGQQPVGQLFPTQNSLSESVRRSSVEILNQCLADTTVLHSQLKSAHWNVKGPTFFQLHELFDELAEVFEGHADDLAERATALGGLAQGTVRIAAQNTTIPQLPPNVVDGRALLQQVATNLAAHDANLYQQINAVSEQGDLDTADLLNEISRDVSKSLWFVEAHLQGQTTSTAEMLTNAQGGATSGQQSFQQFPGAAPQSGQPQMRQ